MGAVLLAACHQSPEQAANSAAATQARTNAADPNAIDCAPAGADAFAKSCTVERQDTPRGLLLTLHNPDGGFHRLLVTQDGHGVAAADGAQPVSVNITGSDTIEVGIAKDRYRLPATVRKRG